MITAADFIAEHGRPPMLGDEVPPWRYRGWLLWYVQRLHAHHRVPFPDRWGYLQAIHLCWGGAGYPDPGPIPQVRFDHRDPAVLKALENAIRIAGEKRHGWGWSALRAFLDWLGWGLGTITEEPRELDDEIQEKLYRTFDLGPWLCSPYDYLATYICESQGRGWNPHAFFPTPHNVCEMMVAMQMGNDDADIRGRSVHDPAMGTGRMLLHASNYSLRLYGQDIDRMMVACTKINGALYAPWIVAPPPWPPKIPPRDPETPGATHAEDAEQPGQLTLFHP